MDGALLWLLSLLWGLGIAGLLLRSQPVRYYAKYLAYFLGVNVVAVFVIPVLLLRPFSVLNLLLSSMFSKHITKVIGLRWTLKNGHHLAEQKACIIVANHQSSLDILGMFQIWDVMLRCTVVAKKELFYAWPFGLSAWLSGLVFIDRINSDKARDTINKVAEKIKEDKTKLWIFPEGTRRNTEVHPFKKGAFHVAVAAQLPIQPVVYSPYYFLDDKSHSFDSGEIIISALPPISTEGLTAADVEDLMARVRKQMVEEYSRVSAEVKSSLPMEKKNMKNRL